MSNGKLVLVVDDEHGDRLALAELLSGEGYCVDTASDGTTAIVRIQTRMPDVVLTDLMMPGVSGIELLRSYRRSAPEVPIIVMTAHDHIRPGADVLFHGALGYLTKPIQVDELLIMLDGLLS